MAGNHLNAHAEAHLPATLDADDALVEVGGYVGMHVEAETADAQVLGQHFDFAFEHAVKEKTALDEYMGIIQEERNKTYEKSQLSKACVGKSENEKAKLIDDYIDYIPDYLNEKYNFISKKEAIKEIVNTIYELGKI